MYFTFPNLFRKHNIAWKTNYLLFSRMFFLIKQQTGTSKFGINTKLFDRIKREVTYLIDHWELANSVRKLWRNIREDARSTLQYLHYHQVRTVPLDPFQLHDVGVDRHQAAKHAQHLNVHLQVDQEVDERFEVVDGHQQPEARLRRLDRVSLDDHALQRGDEVVEAGQRFDLSARRIVLFEFNYRLWRVCGIPVQIQ